MKQTIIPTVFSIKEDDFIDRFERLRRLSKDIQIDIMDGKFVSAKFMDLDIIPDLKKFKNNFEAHLMVRYPQKYISKLKKKGFKKIIFHYEVFQDNKKIISLAKKIKKEGMKVFLAINPETKTHDTVILANHLDGLLFMGVHPGKEHQSFIYEVLEHIRHLRHFNKKVDIQVDGGINTSNIRYIAKAGANIFNTGSYVSENKNPKHALLKLRYELIR